MSFHLVAANLVEEEGKYLLVQEGKEEVRGQWNLPAGGLKYGERPVQGAERECLEETGLEVSADSVNGIYFNELDRADADVSVICFNSEYVSGDIDIQMEEEIMDAGFYSKEEIANMDLRVPFVEEAIERYENNESIPTDLFEDYR